MTQYQIIMLELLSNGQTTVNTEKALKRLYEAALKDEQVSNILRELTYNNLISSTEQTLLIDKLLGYPGANFKVKKVVARNFKRKKS